MAKSIQQEVVLPATAQQVYDALMTTKLHVAFTGEPASISAEVGGRSTAYGDHLEAVNVALEPGKRIVQAWRGCMFPEGEFSILAIELEDQPAKGKSAKPSVLLKMTQHGVPDSCYDVINPGWDKSYWSKLKTFFAAAK